MSGDALTDQLWRELGAQLRQARLEREVSIRETEERSGYSRGMLSLAETGKARPGRDLVRWYDRTFAAAGLLLSFHTEALAAGLPRAVAPVESVLTGDGWTVRRRSVDVAPHGRPVRLRWTVRNTGPNTWTGRRLERAGPVSGDRVLGCARYTAVPDTAPGSDATVVVLVDAPRRPGRYAAAWVLTDPAGRRVLPAESALVHVLTVE